MENIRIENKKLLSIVKKNRDKFKDLYQTGIKLYINSIENALLNTLDKIKEGVDFDMTSIHRISKPADHTDEYDMIIRMLELTVDKIVELDQYEFMKYVQNEWNWKNSFKTTMMSYSGSTGCSGTDGTSGSSGDIDYDSYYRKLESF